MSSCIILQEYDRLFMSGDSATSGYANSGSNEMVRHNDTAKKIVKIGGDVIFCSGMLNKSYMVINFMTNFYNCYKTTVDLNQLTTFLQNAIGMQKDERWMDVGVLVGRIENGQSVVYSLQQYEDFKVKEYRGKEEGTQVWCAGFKVEEAMNYATECIRNKMSVTDTYIKTYEHISCNEVGGTITVYQLDTNDTKMILRQKIQESNIGYFNGIGKIKEKAQNNYIPPITIPEDIPEDAHAVIADVICGNMVMSEQLSIENASGTYTINDNGIEAISGIYSVGITPQIPSQIFNIKVGDDPVFYIDVNSNKLVMNGLINASGGTLGNLTVNGTLYGGTLQGSTINTNSGNIGGWNISSDGLTSYNTVASLNLYNQGNQAMKLSYNGLHLYNHYSGGNEYLGGAVAIYNSSNGTNGVTLCHSNQAEYLSLGYMDSSYPYSGAPIYMDMIYSRNGFSGANPGFTFNKEVYANSGLNASTINGYTPINTNNISSYAAPSFHRQSSYTITPELTAAQNISLYGEPNAASTWWVNSNFELKTASDFRLKKEIKSFDDLPDDLYFELKPKQFKYKVEKEHEGICFGLLAQQVISAFDRYGLNALDYNIVEMVDARSYTDEVLYVKDGKMYRINYQNLHAWSMHILQKLNERVSKLEEKIAEKEVA